MGAPRLVVPMLAGVSVSGTGMCVFVCVGGWRLGCLWPVLMLLVVLVLYVAGGAAVCGRS